MQDVKTVRVRISSDQELRVEVSDLAVPQLEAVDQALRDTGYGWEYSGLGRVETIQHMATRVTMWRSRARRLANLLEGYTGDPEARELIRMAKED